jgi:Flp pilus assembly protein TadG
VTRRDERGNALVELTWLAVLMLVPLVWIVISVFEVQRGAFATAGAARAAARAFALAPDDVEGRLVARQTARRVMVDQGVEAADPDVEVSCVPTGDCHSGGTVITVHVSSTVELPLLPALFGEQRSSFALSSAHTVPIGRYQESR